MKSAIYALLSGFLFSIGLGISQMTNPSKVIGFLDITGNWDPSLAFVMGGAVTVYLIGYKLVLPRFSQPIAEAKFHIPNRNDIDTPLVLGSAIFGIGWALSGFCPGPGITAVVTLRDEPLSFLLAMSLGVIVYRYTYARRKFQDG